MLLAPSLAIAAAVLALGYHTCFAQDFQWDVRADMPAGRWGASTFVIDEVAYVVGGRIGSTDRTEMWAYDLQTDAWEQKASIPVARRLAAAFTINGKGYVCCGLYSTSSRLKDLWEYDPNSDSWTQKADFPGAERYGPYHFALGDYGYVGMGNLGSADGPYANDAYRYDPTSNEWSSIPTLPDLARHGTASFVMNGKAYVFGGKESNLLFSPDLWCFDPNTQLWTLLAPFPGSPRSSPLAFVYSSDAVIGCGRNDAVNFYDVWRFDPSSNNWTIVPDYPGLSSLAGTSFSINGRAFGGLGWVLSTNVSADDLWELVKPTESSISETSQGESLLRIAPVPASSGSYLRLTSSSSEGISIAVRDAQGRLMDTYRFTNTLTIGTGTWSAGSYFAYWQCGSRSGTVPFIISAR